ncbi:MAG TPA: amidohydrolase family protein [Terracidiphilus sp.]|nr:amidohydrolase family protein [Terracidiphilus sp.]
MRPLQIFLLILAGAQLCVPAFGSQIPAAPPPSLVLSGGTVIDVSDWGHSANDLANAVVIIQGDRITEVGPASAVPIPKGARVIDCTGKFIIPGLVDGFEGMNSQAEANANLYMGVTTAVVRSDSHRGRIDIAVNPSPHLYLLDSVGTTDDWSLLTGHGSWTSTLRVLGHPTELSPQDTQRQLADTAKLGTRVVFLGHYLTAVNTQWIITQAHQMGLVTYGEFVATPYRVGIEAGVDALLHMGRYELGLIPDELQQPLVDDPEGPSATTASDYSERLPPTDLHVARYARFIASHHAALMPTLAMYYLRLPGHRNLWDETAAALMNPARMFNPPDSKGEMVYPLPAWTRHLPGIAQRYEEESLSKKADQSALRLWRLNQAIFSAYPHYLAASGAPVDGSFPGVSLHVELEMLVRLGVTPREALAAATNNYALQFHWTELGEVAPGRRADLLVVDGDPTQNVWNARRISTLILGGNVLDRQSLLKTP